jgi:hypothetical protein
MEVHEFINLSISRRMKNGFENSDVIHTGRMIERRRDTSSGQRRPIKTCWLWMVPKKLNSNLHLARADLISRHMASEKFGPLLFPEPFIGRTYGLVLGLQKGIGASRIAGE